jgi:Ca-activated chloride channel family protein
MITRDVYYSFPQAIYLLFFLVPLLFLLWRLFLYRQHILAQYHPSQLIVARSKKGFLFKSLCWMVAWICAVFALMDPKGNLQYQSLKVDQLDEHTQLSRRKAHEIIFLVDTSASMSVPDSRLHRTRLEQAKEIIDDVMSQLQGETVSLYSFTSQLTPLVPSTLDYLFTRMMIRQIRLNEGDVEGTNLIKAFETLIPTLSSPNKLYTILLLSDGGDNQLNGLQSETIQTLLRKLDASRHSHLRLLAIGMGSKTGGIIPYVTFHGQPVESKLEEDLLKELASQYRGVYYRANDWTTASLTRQLIEQIELEPAYEQVAVRDLIPEEEIRYDFYFQIPLGLAILLLILAMLIPDGKKTFTGFLLFFLLDFSSLPAQDSIQTKGQEAQTLFNTRFYSQAMDVYKSLLKENLAPWQRAVITYNLGTVYLAAAQSTEALVHFHSISSQDIFSPWLLRNLQINQGFAYFDQAQSLKENREDQRLYLLEQSLSHLNAAIQTDCRLQLWEDENLTNCLNPVDLVSLLNLVYQQLSQIRQNQRNDILKSNEKMTSLFQLIESLQRFKQQIEQLEDYHSYDSYLIHQGKTLLHLWEHLHEQPWEEEKSKVLDQGYQDYQKALENLSEATHLIEKSLHSIQQLLPEDSSRETIDHLLTNYRILMTYDPLPFQALQHVKTQQDALQVSEKANQSLAISLDQLVLHRDALARFFFFRSFYILSNLQHLDLNDPISILKQAINQARQATQFNYIAHLEPLPHAFRKNVHNILEEVQQAVIQPAPSFIQAVIDLQSERFHQSHVHTAYSRCQKNPWKKAFPLFDFGYQKALFAQKMLLKPSFNWVQVLNQQEQTISYWEKVLNLIEQPPQENPETEQEDSNQSSIAPTNLDEVFHLLQEMESQDRPPIAPQQELHAW